MNEETLSKRIGLLFSLLMISLGLMNIFRGNDPWLGMALLCCSVLFLPVTNMLLKDLFAIRIPVMLKVFLVILIILVNLEIGAIAEGYYPEITTVM